MAKKDRKGAVRSLIAPLTRRQARKEVAAEANLAYGDKIRDYGKQIGASNQQSRQINQWYGQYRNDVAALQNSQRDATDRLGAYSRSWSDDATNRSGAEASRVSGAEDRSAAIRGAVTNPGAGATESAAEEQRRNLRQSYADQTFRTGVANENMLGQLRNASFSGLRDDQRRERNIRLNLQKDRNAAKKEKGLFKVSQMGVKRKEERDWNYQNRTLASDNRNAAAGRALDWATERRLQNEANGSGGGSGGSSGGGSGIDRKNVSWGIAALSQAFDPSMGVDSSKDPIHPYRILLSNPSKGVSYLMTKRSTVTRREARRAVNKYLRRMKQKYPGVKPLGANPGQGR